MLQAVAASKANRRGHSRCCAQPRKHTQEPAYARGAASRQTGLRPAVLRQPSRRRRATAQLAQRCKDPSPQHKDLVPRAHLFRPQAAHKIRSKFNVSPEGAIIQLYFWYFSRCGHCLQHRHAHTQHTQLSTHLVLRSLHGRRSAICGLFGTQATTLT